MSKFTRGPWARSKYGFNVLTSDSELSVCELKDMGDLDLQLANANLIAAAPEMYEALKSAIDLMEMLLEDGTLLYAQAFSICKEALAKADGEVGK